MIFNLFLISFKYNSDPAAKAIKDKHKSFIKCKSCEPVFGNIFNTKGPQIIPINKKPVINGKYNF